MIDLRKIAALNLALQGPVVVRTEFACGVFVSAAMGFFVLFRMQSVWQIVLSAYLFSLAANYIPMLFWVLVLRDRATAWSELGPEWHYRGRVLRQMRRQSLILLVPVVPLFLAVLVRRRSDSGQTSGAL